MAMKNHDLYHYLSNNNISIEKNIPPKSKLNSFSSMKYELENLSEEIKDDASWRVNLFVIHIFQPRTSDNPTDFSRSVTNG